MVTTIADKVKTHWIADAEGDVIIFCSCCTSRARAMGLDDSGNDARPYCFVHLPLMATERPFRPLEGRNGE